MSVEGASQLPDELKQKAFSDFVAHSVDEVNLNVTLISRRNSRRGSGVGAGASVPGSRARSAGATITTSRRRAIRKTAVMLEGSTARAALAAERRNITDR